MQIAARQIGAEGELALLMPDGRSTAGRGQTSEARAVPSFHVEAHSEYRDRLTG